MRSTLLAILMTVLLPCIAVAAPAPGGTATFDAETKIFRLDGGLVTYAFGVNERGELQPVYWGARLPREDRFPQVRSHAALTAFESSESETQQEFGGWGQGMQFEPAVKATFPDGNRDLVLHYKSHLLTEAGVDVSPQDIHREIRVVLHYHIDAQTGILSHAATVTNGTEAKVVLEQVAAGTLNLPRTRSTRFAI